MRKMDGKVKMVGLYAVICAGMLLFTGCTGTNMSDMGTENGACLLYTSTMGFEYFIEG